MSRQGGGGVWWLQRHRIDDCERTRTKWRKGFQPACTFLVSHSCVRYSVYHVPKARSKGRPTLHDLAVSNRSVGQMAEELTRRGPGTCIAMACDVASRLDIDRAQSVVANNEPGGIHLLVNNSGATWGASFEKTPRHSWEKLLNVNLIGGAQRSRTLV